MKYLLFSTHLGKGGAEKIIVDLANNVNSNQTTIICFFNTLESKLNYKKLNKNVILKFIVNKQFKTTSVSLKFLKLLFFILSPILSLLVYFKFKIHSYNIVHINLSFSSLYSIYFTFFRYLIESKEMYVETFHTNKHLLKNYWKPIFKLNWSRVDHLVYEIGEGEFGNKFNNTPVTYIPFALEKNTDFDLLKINEPIIISMVARLRRFEKKLDFIIQILNELKIRGVEYKFIFGGDGEDKDWFKSELIKFDLIERCSLKGYVSDPVKIYSVSHFIFATSVGKKTGLSGLQGILMKRAVIGLKTIDEFSKISNPLFETSSVNDICDFIESRSRSINDYNEYVEKNYNFISKKNDFKKFIQSYNLLFNKILH